MGVSERTLPLERRSAFEGLSCCCEGPASVSASDELPVAACVAAEEPSLLLWHLEHFCLPASAFLALVLAAFASRRVRIHAND